MILRSGRYYPKMTHHNWGRNAASNQKRDTSSIHFGSRSEKAINYRVRMYGTYSIMIQCKSIMTGHDNHSV